ncbi:MAG: hypothetical protein RO257_15360 [Candidatus Kapabacteria bacterium]|nr:hypothetical protein [Candidatus Kapabacteria bacterium]
MRKTLSFIFFGVTFILCVLLFLNYDSKGYDYGLGCTFCDKNLAYNLNPSVDRYYSFTLNDEEDFELIGTGFGYKNSSFIIKDILAYGYNDTSVIVKCTDSLKTIKYLISYETSYKSKKGNPEISFRDLSNNDFAQVKDTYQWIEIDEEKANMIRFIKMLSLLGLIVSLLLLIIKAIKSIKSKSIKSKSFSPECSMKVSHHTASDLTE